MTNIMSTEYSSKPLILSSFHQFNPVSRNNNNYITCTWWADDFKSIWEGGEDSFIRKVYTRGARHWAN